MATKSPILMSSLPFLGVGSQVNIKTEMKEINKSCDEPCRKRQRLDHLTFEEKMMRRKLKNRVAAQSARDRKKAQMDNQEKEIFDLKLQLAELQEENHKLQLQNERLVGDNKRMQSRLDEIEAKQQQINDKVETKNESHQPVEYASLINVSQQKKQELMVAHRWMMLFVGWLMLSLMKSSTSFKNLDKKSLKTILLALIIQLERNPRRMNPQLKWWGPQQNSWNPSKN